MQNSDAWGAALAGYSGQLDNHVPSDKLLQFAALHEFVFPKRVVTDPIPHALTVYTDGSSNGTTAHYVNGTTVSWATGSTSAPVVELKAVEAVLQECQTQALNIYTDSQYIYRATLQIETVPFIGTQNSEVQTLFRTIQQVTRGRQHPCFFGHLRARTNLPGPLSLGSELADAATRQVMVTQEQLAQQSHKLHRQDSNSLRQQFKITREAARQTVTQCQQCPTALLVPHHGVNPRGLMASRLWQMRVTHIPCFGRLKYAHVTVDTYSGFMVATAQAAEAAKHVLTTASDALPPWAFQGLSTLTMVQDTPAKSSRHSASNYRSSISRAHLTVPRDRE